MAPPHFQGSVGGGTSCAQRTSLMLPKNIETGLSSKLPPAVRHHPNYFRGLSVEYQDRPAAGASRASSATPEPNIYNVHFPNDRNTPNSGIKASQRRAQIFIWEPPKFGGPERVVQEKVLEALAQAHLKPRVPPDGREEPGGALYVHSP